ncbi:MAG TPA: glycosyltransferase family 39 protein, partial [Gemmatimonadales bacterium]|nr:glycosyltransferase family 39 protein [Gemmatimonadales bacterium]
MPRSVRVLGGIAIGVAAIYPLMYITVALLRVRYPFELEWMEGGTLDHVRRVLNGQPLYVSPSLHFIPFIYPPLFFYVAAVAAKLLGSGFMPLRLVSILASLISLLLIYRIIRRDGTSPVPALLGACLFAASYRQGGAWLDIARVDSLFLCLVLASFFALRRETAPIRSGLFGGTLLVLAFFTKQAGAFLVPFLLVALAATDWRRLVAFSLPLVLLGGGGALLLDRFTGGWFRYYVFELPQHHPIIGQLLRGFWTSSLLAPFGVALVIGAFHFFAPGCWQRPRLLALDLAFTVGMILCAYLTKIHVGSYDNVVVPAYAAG